ncbi:putative retrotransposon hot spot protein (RHS) [Trypanosoma cruzi]|uniref:Putative retrotransposon hot spot protein (RHS) n=1 Tax=Trypanosoma cruzi TaxID=5693 RepID=A0A2V2V6L0_TRYCR|nr:putative retrotransposon hot spot protein (RHS) [Trypanosoma cruzi]
MLRCCGRLHVVLLRERWALTVLQTGVAVRLHGAPTAPPCECHAQRHWDCGTKQPRLSFGASEICWPQLGGASGMLHRTGVVMAPRSGIPGDGSDAAARRGVEETRRPNWTMSSSVEDVLLEGSTLSTDMKLNDFLRNYVGGRAAVGEDHNVTMQVFVQEPGAYVQDQRLLRIIFNLTEYQELDEMKILLEAINKLHHEGVVSLEQWRDYEGKDTVTPIARGKINAALSRAQTSTPVVFSKVLKGFYNSVYNASWSHVVKVVGGEGMGMEVKEGKPEQSWTYKEVGYTLEKNDDVLQSGAPRPRLMVLTSDKGWPYTWKNDGQNIRDCYVDCEVERVWQIVKGNLTESFSAYEGSDYIPKRHVLIGTPGIGEVDECRLVPPLPAAALRCGEAPNGCVRCCGSKIPI